MAYQYTKQPLRTLFLVYQGLSTLFVRLPLWVFLGIPRQVPSARLRPMHSYEIVLIQVSPAQEILGSEADGDGQFNPPRFWLI